MFKKKVLVPILSCLLVFLIVLLFQEEDNHRMFTRMIAITDNKASSYINDDMKIIEVDINSTIPNVTEENTEFNISDTKKKVETANISAKTRLPEYNLYYCIKFDSSKDSEIKNEDYIIFNDLILLVEENCSILFKYELNGQFSSEPYIVKFSNIENKKSEEKTEKVSEKDLEKEKVDKKDTTQATSPYFIKVNYTANVVTIYTKDENGNYTVPYKAMVCSCGTYTPKSGTYKTTNKYVWRPLINNVYGHYATRIVKKILFHSVPYTSSSNDALEYWEYDKLGQTASEGCVRLTVRDAKWIYNNCPSGTMVEFYSSSNPGPLGKPSAQKISSNVECRDWDPTDPASGNPWHTYKNKQEEIKEEPKEEIKEDTTIENTITNNVINNTTITNNVISNNTVSENIISNNTIIENTVANNTVIENTISNFTVTNTLTNNTTTNTTTDSNPENNITQNTMATNNSSSAPSSNNIVVNEVD